MESRTHFKITGRYPKGHMSRKFKSMKKLFLFFFVCILSLPEAFSQSVNGVPLSDIDVEYVQIVGTAKLLSTKVTIRIDFGQSTKLLSAKESVVKDENGKLMSFNSMIDVLNFMSKNGYDYKDAYVLTISNQNVYHYMLQKRKT